MNSNNKRVRTALFETNIRQYELAHLMGISEMTMIRRLRFELPEEEQDEMIKIIYREYARRQQS